MHFCIMFVMQSVTQPKTTAAALLWKYNLQYSGTSLLRSPTGLGKSDLNGEVTLLQGVICTAEYNLGLIQGDCDGEVFLLVR